MKKWLLLLAILLLLPCSVAAQIYPPELYGEPFVGSYHYPLYWQLEDATGPISFPLSTDLVYIGGISSQEMPPVVLRIRVTIECLYRPFFGCVAPPPDPAFLNGIEFNLIPELNSYGSIVSDGELLKILLFVYQDDLGWDIYWGCLEYTGHPDPWWDWSMQCYNFWYVGKPGSPEELPYALD